MTLSFSKKKEKYRDYMFQKFINGQQKCYKNLITKAED